MSRLLIIVALTALVGWYVSGPIPEGFSEPWKLRGFSSFINLLFDLSYLAGRLHLGVTDDVLRAVDDLRPPDAIDPRAVQQVFDDVGVRAYNLKKSSDKARPALVFYHGGGWALGRTEKYDYLMMAIVNATDLVIVSVDYRLAGVDGVKFPIPLDDCVRATKYFIQNAQRFGVDPRRVAIAGDSAGGNLAAAVSLRLRDEHFNPMPKLQLLIYPVLQSVDFQLPSMVHNQHAPILKRYWMAWFWALYARGRPDYVAEMLNNSHTSPSAKQLIYRKYVRHDDVENVFRRDPYKKPTTDFGDERIWNELKHVMMDAYFAPLLADDLSQLPEAYVFTTRHDVLRDEGHLYAQRLRAAGVPVTYREDPDSFHGICSFIVHFPKEGEQCLKGITAFLNDRL